LPKVPTNINVLKESEIAFFDSPPQFSEEERKQFFILPIGKDNLEFKKTHTQVGYILQKGYFLARNKFFLPNQYYNEDIKYVANLCKIRRDIDISKTYNRFSYNYHKQIILETCNYKPFSENINIFKREAKELVKSSSKPEEIFYTLLEFLTERKIEIPKYYIFAEIITKSLNLFENELIEALDKALTSEQKNILDEFMYLPMNINQELSSHNPYLIIHLKKAEQAATPLKIKRSLKDFCDIKKLHEDLSDFFASNLISNELINYYAIWILKAEHIQFDAIRDIRNKRLYVTSFIAYLYKLRQDYFMDAFILSMQKFYNDVEKNVARNFLDHNLKYKKKEHLSEIRNILFGDKEYRKKMREVIDSDVHDSIKVKLIDEILEKIESGSREEKIPEKLNNMNNVMAKDLKDQLHYEELNKGYRKLANRVARILQVLEFNSHSSNHAVREALKYYQQKEGRIIESKAPIEFINKDEGKHLYSENGEFNSNLYKIFLFKATFDGIKSGSLNLLYSERYKSVDDYLINQKRWEDYKVELLGRAGLLELSKNPQEIIDYLKKITYNQYKITNDNISDNEYLKFTPKGIPKVTTPKIANIEEGYIGEFIGKDSLIPLSRILSNVSYSTDYISSFTHYSRKNAKSNPSQESIYAAIIALGCNISIRKMGRISDGINPDILEYVVRWFFSKNNIDEANRKIVALINSLPLSNIYLDNEGQINTSSDGQKFNIGVPSLNAAYSLKYFGTGKGISAYSSIDAKGRSIYGTIQNPKDRESNYVIDPLLHNEDVVSDTHATDTHGYTEIVFSICNLLGVDFTPRIKNYHEQLLYTFKDKSRKFHEDLNYKILPAKSMYINEKIIIEQWDQILRFLCTIRLRETLPSNILKRLGSYSRQHPIHKALKEVGRIYKTLFLLRYYDELPLRQNIEKQLNRVELSHLFAKAVFFGGNQEFNYSTKEEQDMALGCRQLIQNIIVLWNYLYISEKLSGIEDQVELQKQVSQLKKGSIMTWQHVNMYGEYDFHLDTDLFPFDMNKIKSLNIN